MPAPYAKIACFIDEDPASEAVRAEAVALRAQSPGELHLVHIATTPWPYTIAFPGAPMTGGTRTASPPAPIAPATTGVSPTTVISSSSWETFIATSISWVAPKETWTPWRLWVAKPERV